LSRSGIRVSLTAEGDPATVPAAISREAYRIVQEGLSNALRHGGVLARAGAKEPAAVRLRMSVRTDELEITMENPLKPPKPLNPLKPLREIREVAENRADRCPVPPPPRTGGGRGLPGIAERAALLGGRAWAGPRDGVWRLSVVLPLPLPFPPPLPEGAA
jgi:signal transduction histidine kinase